VHTSTVYLLHFSRPLHHARHYLGSTSDLDQRLNEHRSGQGARLLEVITDLGISFELARTWEGDRKPERRLKNRHNAPRLCPICSPPGVRCRVCGKRIAGMVGYLGQTRGYHAVCAGQSRLPSF
jgi:predicted GIY-YIG superfamily endonuclease